MIYKLCCNSEGTNDQVNVALRYLYWRLASLRGNENKRTCIKEKSKVLILYWIPSPPSCSIVSFLLFNGISTFIGYLMLNSSFKKTSGTIYPITGWWGKTVYFFPKSISSKDKVSHITTGTHHNGDTSNMMM